VLVVWFGEFPEEVEGFQNQIFAVATATVGVAAFAIVLALVEQASPFVSCCCRRCSILPQKKGKERKRKKRKKHSQSSPRCLMSDAGLLVLCAARAGDPDAECLMLASWFSVQLVLEILTQNVSRGSPVYEEGHILLLAWACTQRDREVIWKCLSQVRAASSDLREKEAVFQQAC
jgi:hypothetical protein